MDRAAENNNSSSRSGCGTTTSAVDTRAVLGRRIRIEMLARGADAAAADGGRNYNGDANGFYYYDGYGYGGDQKE